jgi:hypothetical protein
MLLCVDTFLKKNWPRIGLQLQQQQQQQLVLLLLLRDRHGARPGSIWIPISFSLLYWSLTHAPFPCILLLLPANHIQSTERKISLPSNPRTRQHHTMPQWLMKKSLLVFRNEFRYILLKCVRGWKTASVCAVLQCINKRCLSEMNYCWDYFTIYYLPVENFKPKE